MTPDAELWRSPKMVLEAEGRRRETAYEAKHLTRGDPVIDGERFEVLSFDCYGTLIDWESGILAGLRPVLAAHDVDLNDERVLQLHAEIAQKVQAGEWVTYREVLREVVRGLGSRVGFVPSPAQLDCLADSLKNWTPFPDTVAALKALKKKFRLAIISNIDDDLFALSAKHLKVEFDYVITAEQAKSYKPSLHNFTYAIERFGVSRDRILHVAQSVYHDIVPAKTLGLSNVWVNRRKGRTGSGATLPASAQPDFEVPDLRTLAAAIAPEL